MNEPDPELVALVEATLDRETIRLDDKNPAWTHFMAKWRACDQPAEHYVEVALIMKAHGIHVPKRFLATSIM